MLFRARIARPGIEEHRNGVFGRVTNTVNVNKGFGRVGEDVVVIILLRYSIRCSTCALSVVIGPNLRILGGVRSSRNADGKAEKSYAKWGW